jgi:Zn-dependent M28 family amino/carboxypeptidase
LAKRWYEDGTASRLKALINVDMIGDKDLGILQVTNSSDTLRRLVWKVAVDLGYSRYFLNEAVYVDDDHMAFYRLGMNALNLIDFQYGPQNSYWHTARDTVDKLSAHSFEVVGAVLLETIRRLEQTF